MAKHEAKVINNQVWMEKRKLTFPIKKKNEGSYYIVNFEGNGSTVSRIRGALTLHENILRYTIVKQE